MNKKILIPLLMVPFIALAAWLGSIEVKYYNAPRVRIAVTGYDPRDYLSGHYMLLRTVWEDTDCKQFKDNLCPREQFDYSYRFYLPEADAANLDRIVWKDNPKMELEFSYPKNTSPLIRELYIEGEQWREWIQKQPKKEGGY